MSVRRALLTILVFVALWATVSRFTRPTVLPSPLEVTREWADNGRAVFKHLCITGATAVAGFVVASVATMLLVTAFRLSIPFRSTVYPLVLLSQLTPKVAILPLMIAFVRPGAAKTLIAAMICYFPLLESFELGIKEIPASMRDYFSLLKATRLQVYRKLELPHAIPFILSAAKVSYVFATMGAVTSELIYPAEGVGYIIMNGANRFNTPLVFCGILGATLIGALGWIALWLLEKLIVRGFYKYKLR